MDVNHSQNQNLQNSIKTFEKTHNNPFESVSEAIKKEINNENQNDKSNSFNANARMFESGGLCGEINESRENILKEFKDLMIDHAKNKIGDSNNNFRKQHKVFKGVKNNKCNFCGKYFGRKKHLCKGVEKARNDYKIHFKLWNKTGNSD